MKRVSLKRKRAEGKVTGERRSRLERDRDKQPLCKHTRAHTHAPRADKMASLTQQ